MHHAPLSVGVSWDGDGHVADLSTLSIAVRDVFLFRSLCTVCVLVLVYEETAWRTFEMGLPIVIGRNNWSFVHERLHSLAP